MPRLLVIIPDRLYHIIAKGELQPAYYNPGEVFDEVHILMCNDDHPDVAALHYLVGSARLFLHNYPDDLTLVGRRPDFCTAEPAQKWPSPCGSYSNSVVCNLCKIRRKFGTGKRMGNAF